MDYSFSEQKTDSSLTQTSPPLLPSNSSSSGIKPPKKRNPTEHHRSVNSDLANLVQVIG
ncbi:hypothetical protein HMI55_006282 [Coelomomyces lativittatus]|nr:hypothetical protein HMI55_006282 [Coelomomyces lativittatus]